MKIILIITLTLLMVNSQSAYGEKINLTQKGAYLGAYPYPVKNRVGHPYFDAKWAGNIYLLRQKQEAIEFVAGAKIAMTKSALKNARKLAQKKGKKYFAADNLQFQVIHTENKVEVYLDCDVLAFN